MRAGHRRLRNRRCDRGRGRFAGRRRESGAAADERRQRAGRRRKSAAARARRIELSPRRARLRPLRARRPARRCVRHLEGARALQGRRAADHLSQDCRSPRPHHSHRHGQRAFLADRPFMRLLFIGDIVGKPGRDLLRQGLPGLVECHQIDFVIANAENSAGGFGITREIGEQILDLGVDVMTSGNHIWDKKEALDYIGAEPRLLRPANYPSAAPGNGRYLARTRDGVPVGVINIMGRVFMPSLDDPFSGVLREIEALRPRARVIFVDFHAEATSEKIAMGWHLDGKVAALVGTHTHVQTADERILPKGTAYLTDVGMTGPHDSVIGVETEVALGRFLNAMPARFETATGNPRLNAVLVESDEKTGLATRIERLSYGAGELDELGVTVSHLQSAT